MYVNLHVLICLYIYTYICICVCVYVYIHAHTRTHTQQFASFNSLEEVVEKEEKRMEHMRVVLAREKELSETVARLKQELNEERTGEYMYIVYIYA